MKTTTKLILSVCIGLLTFSAGHAQPPFLVQAPDSFATPVLIIIPDKTVDWRTLDTGTTVKANFYYVMNNTGTVQSIVSNNQLIPEHVKVSGKLHVRGDATSQDPKKQFEVSLHKKTKGSHFLGMEDGGKHWVFNDCGAVDVTLMRNVLTFITQNGMGQYAPAWKWFEVFFCADTSSITNMAEILNNHYRGVYLLFDKIRFEKHRVSGKYHKKDPGASDAIIQINQAAREKYYPLSWHVAPASPAEVYEPKLDDLGDTSSVYTEIDNWYSEWGKRSDVIYRNYVLNSDTGVPDSLLRKLRTWSDYQSFATYFLINELAKDQDGYHKSTFMVKRDTVCYAGPLWDKNKSYGNLFNNPDSTSFYNTPSGWLYKDGTKTKNPDANQSPQWWSAMLLDPVFCDTVWSQWSRYKTTLLDTNSMNSFIDEQVRYLSIPTSTAKNLESALLRNNACWQNGSNLTLAKYNQQVSELKNYLAARILWMDTALPRLLKKSGFSVPPH
ncbi:MAG TPA: hypothetical protein DCG19_00460 [Cryomorphaceae bacterium]|nr:hypothetical protein [Owenweeksia sp.]HAD95840.1 hypothetical protein [Cryomorphaceae bacterium]HBF19506.1 hypothetical protein [Cryomorphaceae bacterium]|tara:strand:- start:8911 stop:10401 length:1491 start_codon:yes stop_codon:yes gene_type:complete